MVILIPRADRVAGKSLIWFADHVFARGISINWTTQLNILFESGKQFCVVYLPCHHSAQSSSSSSSFYHGHVAKAIHRGPEILFDIVLFSVLFVLCYQPFPQGYVHCRPSRPSCPDPWSGIALQTNRMVWWEIIGLWINKIIIRFRDALCGQCELGVYCPIITILQYACKFANKLRVPPTE